MPIVTLTTDFGLADHYVGVMKGVILGLAPRVSLVDITHDVPPFSVSEGAFQISEAWRHFPKKTVHVVVVDPGVGSERRPILVEADGQLFVGPDNGVLSLIYGGAKAAAKVKVRHITNQKLFGPRMSTTFHGRDVFAPVAAHLAKGMKPSLVGKLIDDYLRPQSDKPVRTGHRVWQGQVLRVDRFGNLVTNFLFSEFPAVEMRPFIMIPGISRVEKLIHHYGEAGVGEVAVIVGSSGFLEVSANQASAAKILGVGVGAPVELSIY
ncbi:MAG: SAM-dependent chlorinase/fluorinase [Bryobacterales bacterium]|nr:SAM-dependent chlorinase/fluorinase [Bryobacterales bacterium]